MKPHGHIYHNTSVLNSPLEKFQETKSITLTKIALIISQGK